jgi:hypothetical protein
MPDAIASRRARERRRLRDRRRHVEALRAPRRRFRARQTEQHEVVRAHALADLDVRAVERADRERAVERELHVAGARRLHAAVEICSERSAAGMIDSARLTL